MPHLQQLSWVVTDEILSTRSDGKLPLASINESEAETSESVTLDELHDRIRQHLSSTSVHVLRLPEYATHRYSLSATQED